MSTLSVVIRLALVLLAGASFVRCGGGGSDDDGGEVAAPFSGTFVGTLSDGAPIRIEVDGIREIAFTCNGTQVQEVFSPPRAIDEDGRFDVTFADGGRAFDVHGQFTGRDAVDGTLADQLHACDGTFAAVRVQLLTPAASPPTPTVTPTPTFTDGDFFPFSPLCTPTPPPFPWPRGT